MLLPKPSFSQLASLMKSLPEEAGGGDNYTGASGRIPPAEPHEEEASSRKPSTVLAG